MPDHGIDTRKTFDRDKTGEVSEGMRIVVGSRWYICTPPVRQCTTSKYHIWTPHTPCTPHTLELRDGKTEVSCELTVSEETRLLNHFGDSDEHNSPCPTSNPPQRKQEPPSVAFLSTLNFGKDRGEQGAWVSNAHVRAPSLPDQQNRKHTQKTHRTPRPQGTHEPKDTNTESPRRGS